MIGLSFSFHVIAFVTLYVDIDMDSYDNVRTCCKKARICNKCWMFISSAVRVVDASLREDFGFKHIVHRNLFPKFHFTEKNIYKMWTYSGRRGAHCWVADKTARLISRENRNSIVRYLDNSYVENLTSV